MKRYLSILAILVLAVIAFALLYETPQQPTTLSLTVFVTNYGKKYHRDGCASLSRSKIAIAKDDAISRGYDPCKRCRP